MKAAAILSLLFLAGCAAETPVEQACAKSAMQDHLAAKRNATGYMFGAIGGSGSAVGDIQDYNRRVAACVKAGS